MFSTEIGNGWETAVLNTEEEYDFLKQGQRSFSNSLPYWIGGSTNSTNLEDTIEYSDYIENNSGHNRDKECYKT